MNQIKAYTRSNKATRDRIQLAKPLPYFSLTAVSRQYLEYVQYFALPPSDLYDPWDSRDFAPHQGIILRSPLPT